MLKKKNNLLFISLLTEIILLFSLGLFFVFESSTAESYLQYGHQYHFLKQQSKWLIIGFFLFLAGYFYPLKFLKKTSFIQYILAIILLLLVFIPGIGLKLNGARRWISIFSFSFQPAEFLKFALITILAYINSKKVSLRILLAYLFLPLTLLILQPDMGSLLILFPISFGIFFIAGGKIQTLLKVSVAGILLLSIFVLTSSYRLQRFKTFFNPESDPLGASFHIRQITLALGNGGLFGQGIGNSSQKYAYIPEASSDSIFAIIAEEVGFIGSSIIFLIYLTLFTTLYKISQQSQEKFPSIFVSGVLFWLATQFLLNLSAVVALVPLTGVPLPFFSSGGSALVMLMFSLGITAKIAKETYN